MEEISTRRIGTSTIDNAVNLNHCLFCNSSCTNNLDKNEWLSSSLSPFPGNQLDVGVFILRVLLEIPQNKLMDEQVINILDNSSLASSWLTICDQCSKAVCQAQTIYNQILETTRKFRGVQQGIIEKVKRISEFDKQPVFDDQDIKTYKCREFVNEQNYADFGYPFNVHDAESLTKSASSADQMEFTDVFQVKPEPDEQEMQFILPDNDNQTEDKETQVNDLSFSSVSQQRTEIATKKVYRCIPCNKVFNNRQNLFVHNDKYHKADPRRTCEFCGRVLANSATYTRHKKNNCSKKKNIEELIKEGAKGISKEYKCGSCDKNMNCDDDGDDGDVQKNLDNKNTRQSPIVNENDSKKRRLRN